MRARQHDPLGRCGTPRCLTPTYDAPLPLRGYPGWGATGKAPGITRRGPHVYTAHYRSRSPALTRADNIRHCAGVTSTTPAPGSLLSRTPTPAGTEATSTQLFPSPE